ncbi:nuclease-related domain-containing DEAD/DEAH box helicase [Niveibacterium microcysteis]|uniref:DNA 3'-5' helicase II n=1 Tax=Niveibacterium microcysteis TaxID=2811415 RepID=A0ABX7M0H3_9RHOO|nr:ATP-binding domain-containing protein [Niveibacterium microcysteis]QSI75263.1 ATP-binding domain-containing protein [Niveibacterium microcysteis]
MARIYPDGWEALANGASPSLVRLLDTLRRLGEALPDDWAVFHGVHWQHGADGQALFGAVDLALVTPSGACVLIEQRTGFLRESAEGLLRGSAAQAVNVAHHLGRAVAVLREKLARVASDASVTGLLFLPDYRVRQPQTAGLDPALIIDADQREALVARVLALDADVAANAVRHAAVSAFLADELSLTPDVGAAADASRALYTRLSGGLTEWARRLEMSPHLLRVVGTAGSGKTQLALAVYRDALAAGRRPLYVCFNRPLADHVAALVPAGGEVTSFHQLCLSMLRTTGLQPDLRQPDAFSRLETAFGVMAVPAEWVFDEIIIDEGQDFSPAWRDAVLRLGRPGARCWWLEDPMQNLYAKPAIEMPGWVTLRSATNFRSPRAIVDMLNRLMPDALRQEPGSPIRGDAVSVVPYADRESLLEQTRRALTQAIGLGFERSQIALLSFHGRERSALVGLDRLGPIPLRHFTGRYDLLGMPEFSAGDVLCETVYRFKGQSAPCVILSEVDFAVLDDAALRKFFVGATRATMKLFVLASATAAGLLNEAGFADDA